MDVITYTDARNTLKDVMDRAINDRENVVITRRHGEAAVLMSLDEFNAIQETLHLLSSPRNAARLLASVARLDAGQGDEHDLLPVHESAETPMP